MFSAPTRSRLTTPARLDPIRRYDGGRLPLAGARGARRRRTARPQWPLRQLGTRRRRFGLVVLLRPMTADRFPASSRLFPERPAVSARRCAQAALADRVRAATPHAPAVLPGVVWLGLFAGAVVSVGMLFALQIRRSARELVPAGPFTALIALLLFLVRNFDEPFAWGLVNPDGAFAALFPQARAGGKVPGG
jgi:hypothetical protein